MRNDSLSGATRGRESTRTARKRIVIRAAAALAKAGHAAHDLGRALDDAHQFLAHLAATEPDRTNEPGSDASADTAGTVGKSGSGPRDGRAEAVAPSGHFQATSGQVYGCQWAEIDVP